MLARHGMGYLISAFGLERFVPFHKSLFGQALKGRPYTPPERVRLALEELGTTFIKIGQILSTRADLLPPEYLAELAKLQDAAPPVPFDQISEAIVNEMGAPPGELFASFAPLPMAAASIGQAHMAVNHDGTEVVVKVRRPGVVQRVEEDLELLDMAAAAAARRWEFAESYDVVGLAQEFAQTLRAELDYIREGRSAERFADNFAGDPFVHIPRVYWETTTPLVLTLERIKGSKITDAEAFESAGLDRRALADRASRVILKMVFEDGFYHADPHPGNFFIEDGGRLGLIDFGMVGTVDERTQSRLAQVMLAIVARDSDRIVDALLEVGVSTRRVDRRRLSRDIDHLLNNYYGKPLSEIAIGPLLNEVFAVVRDHHLHLPPSLALLLKTVIMSESVGVLLNPEFRLTEILAPYAEEMMARQYSPSHLKHRLGQMSLDMARLGADLPLQLRRIVGDIERGGLEIGVRPEHFEPVIKRFERLTNRVVLGIIAAAFINGLAVLISVYRPAGWEGFIGVLFAFGFVVAVVLGLYLAWTIVRSGRG